jgi:hypothetical protein
LQHGLICRADLWSTQGLSLHPDRRKAFNFKVSKYGNVVGDVTADRSVWHPEVMWNCTLTGESRPFVVERKTVDEAFAAFATL